MVFKREGKIRILCTGCLYSKILPIHESDPKGTRVIVTNSCEKCNLESDGNILYFDDNMNEVTELIPSPQGEDK